MRGRAAFWGEPGASRPIASLPSKRPAERRRVDGMNRVSWVTLGLVFHDTRPSVIHDTRVDGGYGHILYRYWLG